MSQIVDKPVIAVVGSSSIDFVTYSSVLPRPGETLIGNKYEQRFGGKGANQCVAAARLGATTLFVTSLGSDYFGTLYLEKLQKENVDVSCVKIQKNIHTGIAQITVSEKENSIVMVQGANSLLTPKDVAQAKDKIISASVLLCQMEIPIESTLEALKIHKGHGISIVNFAPAVNNFDLQICKLCDIFCVNEIEAEIVTGVKNMTIDNAQEVIDILLSFGCNVVIITMGEKGVVHAQKESRKLIHTAAETVTAIDTTGAGDSFLGSLAYYKIYHPHLSLEECIKKSNKVASLSVTKTGTQTSFPFRNDLPSDLH